MRRAVAIASSCVRCRGKSETRLEGATLQQPTETARSMKTRGRHEYKWPIRVVLRRITPAITCGARRARALRAPVRVPGEKEISKARDRPYRQVHRVVMPSNGKEIPEGTAIKNPSRTIMSHDALSVGMYCGAPGDALKCVPEHSPLSPSEPKERIS